MSRGLLLPLGLSVGLLGASVPAAELTIEFELAETAKVGDRLQLEVTVTNQGSEDLVIREPVFDHRSFDFMVRFDEGRESRYTKYHPAAGAPSLLAGQDLEAGSSATMKHQVIALKAGRWTFQPIFRGASGGPVEGPARSVQVGKDGEVEELLVRFETGAGRIEAVFWPEAAPATSLHVAELVAAGFYDQLTFHRTIPGFMIQGGCPQGDGTGNPGYTIEAEFNARKHVAGVWSMARSADPYESMGQEPRPQFANSAGSQFFLCDGDAPFLDGKYTAFGQVVTGLEVVHEIAAAPATQGLDSQPSVPVEPVVMKRVTLMPRPAVTGGK
jgi:cyclophilin family peptidyl-prolyl cis-trans isomerase